MRSPTVRSPTVPATAAARLPLIVIARGFASVIATACTTLTTLMLQGRDEDEIRTGHVSPHGASIPVTGPGRAAKEGSTILFAHPVHTPTSTRERTPYRRISHGIMCPPW